MKVAISLTILTGLRFSPSTSSSDPLIFRPKKFSYDSLVNQEEADDDFPSDIFMQALTHDGIISISNIPGYASRKQETLKNIHKCAINSSATRMHTYSDGTTRLTMATHTVPGPGGQQTIRHSSSSTSQQHDDDNDKPEAAIFDEACYSFSISSDHLRHVVNKAILSFSTRLDSLLNFTDIPLLSTKNNVNHFDNLTSVVENGDHLEHFHSYYQRQRQKFIDDNNNVRSSSTIDMHTDQGLFIAFTPALVVDTSSSSSSSSSSTGAPPSSKSDFYIETRDGLKYIVKFDPDDLVIMLGDGVNQIVNPRIKSSSSSSSSHEDQLPLLRATPHSVSVNHQDSSSGIARVWYGRMILPPPGAIHPSSSSSSSSSNNDQMTFGELRRLMIQASLSKEKKDDNILKWGCSDSHQKAHQLEEVSCAAGSMYCWHKCMNYSNYGVSEEICAERNLQLQCVNEEGEVFRDDHGDYYPDCFGSLLKNDGTPETNDTKGEPNSKVIDEEHNSADETNSPSGDLMLENGDNEKESSSSAHAAFFIGNLMIFIISFVVIIVVA